MFPIHLYIITIGITLFWSALWVGIAYVAYKLLWKPSIDERKAKAERRRHIADRRG